MNLPPGRQKVLLGALLVAASTFVLYSGALKNDFIGWDDEFYVLANPYITPLSAGTIGAMFSNFHFKSWTPLTLLSHAIDYSIWGLDPRGHHLVSMVIHALNGIWIMLLTFALLKRYRGRGQTGGTEGDAARWDVPLFAGSVASALFFAWHPLRVEAVACASSRKDLLSTFFIVPSLLLYIRYADRRGMPGAWRPFAASLFLFGLSLLAKASVMTMAGILLVVDLMSRSAGGDWKHRVRILIEKIPYLLLGCAAAYVAYVASEGGGNMAQVLRAKSEYSSLELGLYNCSFYLIKTVWPAELAELYTYPKWGPFLIVAAVGPIVTLLSAVLWGKGRRSLLYAWGAYLIALLPMAGFVASSIQVIANRYAYWAAVPFCILFGAAVMRAWGDSRISERRWGHPVLVLTASVLLAALAARTAIHVGDWRDAETVWRHTITVSPGHALAHNELGLALLEKQDFAGAIASFKRSVELYPQFSEAMCNMGGAYVSMGDSVNAERILRQALALSPGDYATYTNLGNVRMIERKYAEAASFYRRSLEMNPRAAVTTYDLAYATMLTGNQEEALSILRRAVVLNPNYRDAYFLMGEILSHRKDGSDDALRAYRKAARLGHEQSQRILAARGIDW